MSGSLNTQYKAIMTNTSTEPRTLREALQNAPAGVNPYYGVFVSDVVFDPADEITRDKLTDAEFEKVIGGKPPRYGIFALLSFDDADNQEQEKLRNNPALQYKSTIISEYKTNIKNYYDESRNKIFRICAPI
jgi:hypothetical protein